MGDVLVVLGPLSSPVKRTDLAAIGFGLEAAAALGGGADVLCLGPRATAAAEEVSGYGVRTVYVLEHSDLEAYTAEAYEAAVVSFLAGRSYRLAAAATSSASREFLPRVAARLDAPMASDVLGLESADDAAVSFARAVFVGNLHAVVALRGETVLATCRASAFEPPAAGSAPGKVEAVTLEGALANPRKRSVGLEEQRSERPELAEADIVVSAGRGTRGPDEGIPLVAELADALGAALGATRAVVDAGWLPNELQVGQTGKVVAPKLYIAIGLSGSIQHLAGMRNSKTIVAINKDPEAPIFEVADVGLVADLFQAVPELTAKVRAVKGAGR